MSQVAFKLPISPEIDNLLAAIRAAGGHPVLVGGCVRDALLGLSPKDIDIEVYGLAVEPLKASILPLGRVFAVGVSFGVLKVYLNDGDGSELDVSLPRRESHPGDLGAMDTADPATLPEEAASRRDFTINAILYDPQQQILQDFFGGRADLEEGILRHVGPAFAEDPLRVLRGMQFAARWNFRLAGATTSFCAGLRDRCLALPGERVWGEWAKFFLKGDYPTAGMQVLAETGWRDLYPPLQNLVERGLWKLTEQTLERAVEVARRDKLSGEERLVLVLATLSHHFDSEQAAQFFSQITCPHHLARQAMLLIKERLTYSEQVFSPTSVRRLAFRLAPVTFSQWTRLVEITDPPANGPAWLELAETLGYAAGRVNPLVQGRDLLEAGLVPGQHFKKLLDDAMQAQLDGHFSTPDEARHWLTHSLSAEKGNASTSGQ